jgi:hypothetical protein
MDDYGKQARLRLAMSDGAARLSERTGRMVATSGDADSTPGMLVDQVAQMLDCARQLLELAVCFERSQGTTWDDLGSALGISRQAIHERYASRAKELDELMTLSWVVGRDHVIDGLPEAASDPAAAANRLDKWVAEHRCADEQDTAASVAAGLRPMSMSDIRDMLHTASRIVNEYSNHVPRLGLGGTTDLASYYHLLQLAYTHREVQWYRRILASEYDAPGTTGSSPAEIRTLLETARQRLVNLENDGIAADRRMQR